MIQNQEEHVEHSADSSLLFLRQGTTLLTHTHFFVPYILHLTHMQKQSPAPASAAQAEPCAALTPEPVFLYHVSK